MGRAGGSRIIFAFLAVALLVPVAAAGEAREERLVSFHDTTPNAGATFAGVRVVEAFPFAGVALVEGPASALLRLADLPNVAGVYHDDALSFSLERSRATVGADAPPNDASWPSGAGATIALVDSGIDATHPAFDGRILSSVRVTRSGGITDARGDDDGHGTHIAGILAGNGAGSRDGRYHGIAPGSNLVTVDISEAFTTTTAIRAFQWVHDNKDTYGIRVVSNSWGREREDARYDPEDPVIRASDSLVADGLVVVFSAGNRGRAGESTLTPEASNPNVLSVGAASMSSGRVEPYSSRGPALDDAGRTLSWTKPDLVAPGTGILSTRSSMTAGGNFRTDEERYYVGMNGTSMAAPHVAAAAALLLAAEPTLTPAQVATLLTLTARDVGARGPDAETGHGMLDVRSALDAARAMRTTERTVLVERVIPVRAQGSLTALGGMIVLEGGNARVPPEESVIIPLAAPPGATRVTLHLNWTGPGTIEADLVLPGGARVPFQDNGPSSLRYSAQADSGTYRVVARSTGAASNTPFVVEGGIVVLEERTIEVPGELHARDLSPQGGFFETRSGTRALIDVPMHGRAFALFVSVGVLAGVALAARRKK